MRISHKSQVTNHKLKRTSSLIRCFIFIYFLAYGLLPTSYCQSTLYGKITDKEGKPISDVKISVSNSKITTNSNEKGEYELTIPSDTTINIEFSHVSFGIR